MLLVALKKFTDSVGTYPQGSHFRVSSSAYGRELIQKGLAAPDPSAPPQRVSPTPPALPRVAVPKRSPPPRPLRVRGASGLGDSLYLRPIIEHLVAENAESRPVHVMSDYPQVFDGVNATVLRFNKMQIDVIAHYASGKSRACTTQFQDMCIAAGVPTDLPLIIEWPVKNRELIERVERIADGRRIVLVHGGRPPMDRALDHMGMELLPRREEFQKTIDMLHQSGECLLVKVGKGKQLYPVTAELDLSDKTSVYDLMDLGRSCDGIVGQCSFVVPLAEVFVKPLLVVWAAKSLRSSHTFMRAITPEKILHRKSTSRYVIDNWNDQQIRGVVDAFLDF